MENFSKVSDWVRLSSDINYGKTPGSLIFDSQKISSDLIKEKKEEVSVLELQ